MPSDFSQLPPDRRAEAEAMHARMMAALSYERTTIDGAHAAEEWQRLRQLGKGWPVLIGDDEALERIAEQYSIDDPSVFGAPRDQPAPRDPHAILEAAKDLKFPADLAKWPGAYQPEDLHAEVGEWPAKRHTQSGEPLISVAFDIVTGRPYDRVHVLFIPTQHSWEVPAYLRWGNWNACPPPEYHVAALRHWHDAYGVELAGIAGDRIDLWVPRPPAKREDALAVAREIYRYCPDIVDQGTETLSALAAEMVMGNWWGFWWD